AAVLALPRSLEADAALCEIALFAAPAESIAAGREMRRRGGCQMDRLMRAFALAAAQRGKAGRAKKTSGSEGDKPPSVPAALGAIAALGTSAQAAVGAVLPLIGDRNREVNRLALEAIAQLRDPSAADEVNKAYDGEARRMRTLQAKWTSVDPPQKFAPGFSAGGAPRASPGAEAAKHAELLRRVADRNAARGGSGGREATPPAELAEDVPPDQLRLLAAAVRALGMT